MMGPVSSKNKNVEEMIQEIQKGFSIIGRERELREMILARLAGRHIIIEGTVGVGKTTIARAVADYFDQSFIRIDGDERYTEAKLVGHFEPPLVVEKGWTKEAFVSGPLTLAMERGSVFFVNEANRLIEGTQNVLLPALDEGLITLPQLDPIHAQEGFFVVATQNPDSYIGTTVLSEALKDRFVWIRLDRQNYQDELNIVLNSTSKKDPKIVELTTKICRATRNNPDIKRGASVRGAIDFAKILELVGELDVDTITELAIMTLATKIEIEDGVDKKVEDVITEIIAKVMSGEVETEENKNKSGSPVLRDQRQIRLFGKVDPEDVMKSAIESGHPLPPIEKMESKAVERLTESAVDSENLPALVSLSKINRYAVSNALNLERLTSLGRVAGKGGVVSSRLYFVVRGVLDPKRRRVFRRLARTALLKQSLRIAGEGLRGDLFKQSLYEPGLDFDLEETIDQTMERYPDGIPVLGINDIVGIDRVQRKKSGVLILDTSGSMFGERNINAALTAAIMAYSMRKDDYSVIAFNTKAFIIKKFDEEMKVQDIVDRILDLEAIGHTNIEDALKVGARELRRLKTRFKWAILFTDGVYNKGKDPRYLAREFKKLHVINLPGKKWGMRVCQDLSRLGAGKYVAVRSYEEAPRALMRILRSPW